MSAIQCECCGCDVDGEDVHYDRFGSDKEYCSQECADEEFFDRAHIREESHSSNFI